MWGKYIELWYVIGIILLLTFLPFMAEGKAEKFYLTELSDELIIGIAIGECKVDYMLQIRVGYDFVHGKLKKSPTVEEIGRQELNAHTFLTLMASCV